MRTTKLHIWYYLCGLVSLCCTLATSQSSNNFIINANVYDGRNDPALQWCKAPSESSWKRPFLVAVLADPQLGWNTNNQNSETNFREAAYHLERLRPDLIVIVGDMIDTPSSDDAADLTIIHNILEGLRIPYYLTSGNHDIFHQPGVDALDKFVNYWGTPYYWYSVEYSNTLFVFVESNVLIDYKDNSAPQAVRDLADEQLAWLQSTLKRTNFDHIIPIAHHPLAVQSLNEAVSVFNTPPRIRMELESLYESNPTISHVFSGHIHRMSRLQNQGVRYIAYPATGIVLGQEPAGFALLTVEGSQPLREQYYAFSQMPSVRPDTSSAGFDITFPRGGIDLPVNANVCITWKSSSMADRVRVLYSTNSGASWNVIGTGPNVGVYPWKIPSELSSRVLVAVASVYNPKIIGVSAQANRIVVPRESSNTQSSSGSRPTQKQWMDDTNKNSTSTKQWVHKEDITKEAEEHDFSKAQASSSNISSQSEKAMAWDGEMNFRSATTSSQNRWMAMSLIATTTFLTLWWS